VAALGAIASRVLPALAESGGAAGKAASNFQALGQAAATVNPILAQLTPQIPDVFGKLKAGIAEVNSQVVSFVSKLNPAFINRWNLAVDDLYATVGRSLVPALQQATSVVRRIGDAFASLDADGKDFVSLLLTGGSAFSTFGAALEKVLPPLVSIFNSLGKAANAMLSALEPVTTLVTDLAGAVLNQLADSLEAIIPLIELVGAGMKVMGQIFESLYRGGMVLVRSVLQPVSGWLDSADTGIRTVIEQVTIYLKAFGEVIEEYVLGPLRDMTGAETGVAKSSVGAASRSTSVGDQMSFINKSFASAFGASAGVQTEDQKRTALAKQVADAVEEIKAKIDDLVKVALVYYATAEDVISGNRTKRGAQRLASDIGDLPQQGRDMLRNLTGF
jgi:methyl-accepting chemotaxis protein